MESELRFTSTLGQHGGLIASMLKRSYAELIRADPEHWGREVPEWERFDHEVFEHPDTVGICVFLSWSRRQLVGFASYDPRQGPKLGIVGHNCVLPEFRGNGFGNQQVWEVLRRFQAMGIRVARTSTGDGQFFIPARRMYAACGFREAVQRPWPRDPSQNIIEYELTLDKQDSQAMG